MNEWMGERVSLMPVYLVDAGGHLLYKQAFLLPLAHQAGEQSEPVVVGPGGPRGRLGGDVGRGGSRAEGTRRPQGPSQH